MNTYMTENRKSFLKSLTQEAYASFDEVAFEKSLEKITDQKSFNSKRFQLQKLRKKLEETTPVNNELWKKQEEAKAWFTKQEEDAGISFPPRESCSMRQAREIYNAYISKSGQHTNKTPKMFGKLVNLLKDVKKMTDEQAVAFYNRLTFHQANEMITSLSK